MPTYTSAPKRGWSCATLFGIFGVLGIAIFIASGLDYQRPKKFAAHYFLP